jgi:hypothetical protein
VLNTPTQQLAPTECFGVEFSPQVPQQPPVPGETTMARRQKRQPTKPPADIFASTRPSGEGKRRPGRPPVHDEAWTKVTVVLFNRQIVFLDRLASNIRAQSGAAISRAQLIRALVDALSDGDIDLTTARSEQDLKATLLARLGRYRLNG